ncbi:FBD-associated F-box protein [Rhynchospora pubera]|uniref:FBD-associated F-box protein n=1 Tax=Rhynchospora pubera TaxID=906938 RepID=A0AAV8DNH5_9POAL|nr:FBD-associated F-box protein [Rhynchospora pubera]
MGRGEDRISILPNEILQVILCLMPLKYAIRTSTLSKRWRHLWQINLISSTALQFGEDFSCNQSPKQFVTTLDRYIQLHGDRKIDKLEEDYQQEFFNILSDFSQVKTLTICSTGLMNVVDHGLEYGEADMPLELHNLQELQVVLNSIREEPIYWMFSFLRLCPSPYLEKLFIQLPSNGYQQNDQKVLVPKEKATPDIVFQNLKWIKITNFGGTALELKLVRFLLEKAILLESIIFVFMNQWDISNNSSSLRIIEGQLSVIQKASKDVNIVICGPLDHDCTINPTHTTFYHQERYQNGTTLHFDYGSTRSEDIPLDQEFL